MSLTNKRAFSGITGPLKGISRPSRLRLLAILLVTLLVLILHSCSAKTEKIKPLEEPITESVYASGIIKRNHQYTAFSTVNGVISLLLVEQGSIVGKGDPILSLEHAGAQLNTVNAVFAARSRYTAVNAEQLKELQITVRLAKAKMDEDVMLFHRQQHLWMENIGTKDELKQRQLTAKTSAGAYASVQLRYTQLRQLLDFQKSQTAINLKIANSAGADYTFRSGIEDQVYKIGKRQGEMVNTLSPVAIIGDAAFFHIELQVDENDINRIRKDQEIMVSMDSYKDQLFTARVTVINPIMNETSRSFTVEAVFLKSPASLFPDLTCEANIVIQQKAKAITISRTYLMEGDSVMMTRYKKIKVQVGLKNYHKAEIIKGLSAEEYILKPVL